ncbi:MAG: YraN family protein [Kofleriaceae bacterium]|nr:YraN family protein [Kofleriaceae bacterium]
MDKKTKGHTAELAAVAFLRSKNYTIVETNYTCSLGELDIIARVGDELVFVEVRSRADADHGDALYAVGPAKQRQVARVAQVYLGAESPNFVTCRFDVIGITDGKLEHIIDAFRA